MIFRPFIRIVTKPMALSSIRPLSLVQTDVVDRKLLGAEHIAVLRELYKIKLDTLNAPPSATAISAPSSGAAPPLPASSPSPTPAPSLSSSQSPKVSPVPPDNARNTSQAQLPAVTVAENSNSITGARNSPVAAQSPPGHSPLKKDTSSLPATGQEDAYNTLDNDRSTTAAQTTTATDQDILATATQAPTSSLAPSPSPSPSLASIPSPSSTTEPRRVSSTVPDSSSASPSTMKPGLGAANETTKAPAQPTFSSLPVRNPALLAFLLKAYHIFLLSCFPFLLISL